MWYLLSRIPTSHLGLQQVFRFCVFHAYGDVLGTKKNRSKGSNDTKYKTSSAMEVQNQKMSPGAKSHKDLIQ